MGFDPIFLDIVGAQKALNEIGVKLSKRQIKRAAKTDVNGISKLPFFIDPIDGRLKIEKSLLFQVYSSAQEQAAADAKVTWENSRVNRLNRILSAHEA